MHLLRFLLLFIFIFSCNTEPIRKEIIIGKTIKIMPSNFGTGNLSTNYNFLWSKPIGPNNSETDLEFKIQNDKMLFTPFSSGNYDIDLTIENLNNTSLYQETFSYYAVGDNNTPAVILVDSNGQVIVEKVSTNKKEKNIIENKKSKVWTIQIMSDPSIEVARKKQLELNNKGFDAYTESIFIKDKNVEYWRVRIGNFTNKETGLKVVKSLEKLGYDTWFTSFYQ